MKQIFKPKLPNTAMTHGHFSLSTLSNLSILGILFFLFLTGCEKINLLKPGKYMVLDQEYSSQNYQMERVFNSQGTFIESHTIDHCLLMEMTGTWKQEKENLMLTYAESQNRANCHDSLPALKKDSSDLKIPLRNIQVTGFESFLTASGGKAAKWIQWNKMD